jgi:UDP-glucose 4-epimerase
LNVLVAGASGFLGRNLLASAPRDWQIVALYNQDTTFPTYLRSIENPQFTCEKCDLTDEKAVASLAEDIGRSFDACVFLAANSDPARSIESPRYDWMANVGTLVNVLDTFKFNRFVFLSSGAVYDGNRGDVSPDTVLIPRLPYAISKLACEHYIRSYHKKGTLQNYLILRFFGAYGPYEPARKIYSRLVKTFCIRKEQEFTVRGNGKNLIDAMYVSDAVQAFTKAVLSDADGLTLDLCHGSPLPIDELVLCAARTFGIRNVKINHVGEVAEYIQFRASPEEARRILNTHPKVSLENGLRRLARFLSAQTET